MALDNLGPISSADTAASACLVAAAECIIIRTAKGLDRLAHRSRWQRPARPYYFVGRSSAAPELTWHFGARGCRFLPSGTAFMMRWRDYLMTGDGRHCIGAQLRFPHSYSIRGRARCLASDKRQLCHPACRELVPSSDCHRYWASDRCSRTLAAVVGCMIEAWQKHATTARKRRQHYYEIDCESKRLLTALLLLQKYCDSFRCLCLLLRCHSGCWVHHAFVLKRAFDHGSTLRRAFGC